MVAEFHATDFENVNRAWLNAFLPTQELLELGNRAKIQDCQFFGADIKYGIDVEEDSFCRPLEDGVQEPIF